jgi:hypothetical protein
MNIVCTCQHSVGLVITSFGTSYVKCSHCGREYEVFAEFSQVRKGKDKPDLDESGLDGTQLRP